MRRTIIKRFTDLLELQPYAQEDNGIKQFIKSRYSRIHNQIMGKSSDNHKFGDSMKKIQY